MGKLTTHVLDQTTGKPAFGMKVTLYSVQNIDGDSADMESYRLLDRFITNEKGRTDNPLLSEILFPGKYQLKFFLADYFRESGHDIPELPFLDTIVIDVGISTEDDYHIPLLCTPWSYSTYRGS
jgi:5-hydroxyisourate hydrolase